MRPQARVGGINRSGAGTLQKRPLMLAADFMLIASSLGLITSSAPAVAAPTPLVENVVLSPDPADVSEDLSCAFDLTTGSTSATAWTVDSSPLATLLLPMEGGAASALEDFSGNSNDAATTYGDPAWSATAGHDGNGAFVFDGNDGLDAGEVFPTGSSYTKTAWVYRTGGGGNNILSGDANSGGHAFWAVDTHLQGGHNGTWNSVQDSVPLATDTWYHVAVTYDWDSQLMTLYKNGAVVDSDTVGRPTSPYDASVRVGTYGTCCGMVGTIDDAAVYQVALSEDQIEALYAAGAGDQNTMVAAETTVGQEWQCQVTPFSDTEAGTTETSNTATITSTAPTFTVTYDGNTNTGGTAPVDPASP